MIEGLLSLILLFNQSLSYKNMVIFDYLFEIIQNYKNSNHEYYSKSISKDVNIYKMYLLESIGYVGCEFSIYKLEYAKTDFDLPVDEIKKIKDVLKDTLKKTIDENRIAQIYYGFNFTFETFTKAINCNKFETYGPNVTDSKYKECKEEQKKEFEKEYFERYKNDIKKLTKFHYFRFNVFSNNGTCRNRNPAKLSKVELFIDINTYKPILYYFNTYYP